MILNTIQNLINYRNYVVNYSQQEMFDALNKVCKKYDITSYELDIKLSKSLLENFSIDQIADKSLIMKALEKLLNK